MNETVNMAPPNKSADITTPNIVKYNWSEKDVGSLQSAYFIGYLGTEYALHISGLIQIQSFKIFYNDKLSVLNLCISH